MKLAWNYVSSRYGSTEMQLPLPNNYHKAKQCKHLFRRHNTTSISYKTRIFKNYYQRHETKSKSVQFVYNTNKLLNTAYLLYSIIT